MQKLFLILSCIITVDAATTIVEAQERYAVLVGVGEYQNLPESLQLQGPPNDVHHMRDYLTNVEGFSEDNIVWLTDGAPRLPRRAAILAELENLEQKLVAGDFALLYFAGHGSQQPAGTRANEEFDGYDEIFLPADVKNWNMDIGAVENAIVDDTIGEFISAYRRKGVDVWVIFDSCHSGTMTRGVGDELKRTRQVSPKDLGIPDVFDHNREPGGDSDVPAFADVSTEPAETMLGALIAFSASHTSEETPEWPMPKSVEESEREVMGLFTHSIIKTLGRFPNVSYNELAQLIISEYASIPYFKATPQFYGTDMNRGVFGRDHDSEPVFSATANADDWSELKVTAGKLRAFDVSAGVSIHANPADESLLGTGIVVAATNTTSTIEAAWKEDAALPRHHRALVYIRLVQPAFTPAILITQLDTVAADDNRRLREIVDALEADGVPLVTFSDSDPAADYVAAFFDARFWLLRPDQSVPCSAQRITEEKRRQCERTRVPEQILWSEPDDARTLVSRAARARNLVKLQSLSGAPTTLKLMMEIERGNSVDPSREPQIERSSLAEHGGILRPGDKVYVSASNESRNAWDIFFFYVDSNLGITPMQRYGESARVLSNEQIDGRLIGTINDLTVGTESLVVIADPVQDGREADYYFLAQEGYRRVATRGGDDQRLQSPLQSILEAVWEGDDNASSRGMEASGTHGSQAHVKVFTWRVE